MPEQHHDPGRHEDQRGQHRGRRRALGAGQASPDLPVEQDVAGPASGGQQAQADAEIVGGRPRAGQCDHARAGHQRAHEVRPAARRGQGDGERAEELQRHRQAEAEPADRGVQGQVHGAVGRREQHHRAPLRPGERAPPGAPGGQQHDPGDPLADRDHARRADHAERQCRGRRAQLVGQGTAEHQGRARPRAGSGTGGAAPGGRRRGRPATSRRTRIVADLNLVRGRHTASVRLASDCVKCMKEDIYTI